MTAAIRVTIAEPRVSVTLRHDEITALDVAAVNHVLGSRFAFEQIARDPKTHDLDAVAALLWIGWRRTSPHLTFEQVAVELTYDLTIFTELIPEIEAEDVEADEPEVT